MRAIRHGYQDIVLCGGSENGIIPFSLAGFQNMKALHTGDDPTAASIPFDARRSGFVMGEGAGALVLESLSHAQARGAAIYAELSGYANTSDAHHVTAPHPEGAGAAACMRRALKRAGLQPSDIGYINAHGTSTGLGDIAETQAVKAVFGGRESAPPVSSTKSMTGHLLGGATAVEAIACAMATREDIIPPTIGYKEPDPDCDLDITPQRCSTRASARRHLQFARLRRAQCVHRHQEICVNPPFAPSDRLRRCVFYRLTARTLSRKIKGRNTRHGGGHGTQTTAIFCHKRRFGQLQKGR